MTIGSHQQSIGKSQVHLTPKWLIDTLGPFELDPCAANPRPWDCATYNIDENSNGLRAVWHGRVWLNPPFHRYKVADWMAKMSAHNNGIALLHARTETGWFRPVWENASGILFMSDRIKFCRPDGSEQPANSGAPIVLVSFNQENLIALKECGIPGALVTGWWLLEKYRVAA